MFKPFKKTIVRKKKTFLRRKKICKLCRDKVLKIDYKDIKFLEKFVTERGKIISARVTGNCAKHQNRLSQAIKRARFVALLPYTL